MTVDETKICDEIWEKYKPQLQKLCAIKLKSYPDEVDDVISEVFLALCEQVAKREFLKNQKRGYTARLAIF